MEITLVLDVQYTATPALFIHSDGFSFNLSSGEHGVTVSNTINAGLTPVINSSALLDIGIIEETEPFDFAPHFNGLVRTSDEALLCSVKVREWKAKVYHF